MLDLAFTLSAYVRNCLYWIARAFDMPIPCPCPYLWATVCECVCLCFGLWAKKLKRIRQTQASGFSHKH